MRENLDAITTSSMRKREFTYRMIKKASNWDQACSQLSIRIHYLHAIRVPKFTSPYKFFPRVQLSWKYVRKLIAQNRKQLIILSMQVLPRKRKNTIEVILYTQETLSIKSI